MNKERRKLALKRNVEMTDGALAKAYVFIQNRDKVAIAFPEFLEKFIADMKRKLEAYTEELKRMDSDAVT
jgi:hypothetical protein